MVDRWKRTCRAGVWLLVAYAGSAAAADSPVVFWTSGPNQPGDCVLVSGSGLADISEIRVARLAGGPAGAPRDDRFVFPSEFRSTRPIQPSAGSVKFVLPEPASPGIFAAEIRSSKGASVVVLVNRPEAWWCQGDAGTTARPGGWVRVFGRCLGAPGGSPPMGGATIYLKGPMSAALDAKADAYAAVAKVPENLPPGDYEVFVHGGHGGRQGWSDPLKLAVARPAPWPQAIFNVKGLGAKGDGATDDTPAIAKTLEKAGQSGGGVVYFPRGTYRLSATLHIPAKTVLRGEREDLAHLVWTTPWNKRLGAVLVGTKQFGLEDVSFTFVGADNGLLAGVARPGVTTLPKDQPMCREPGQIFLRRVRMRWLLYADHLTVAEANKLFTETARDGGYGATGYLVCFGGRDIEITDCDLYSSGNVFNLVEAKGAILARNRFSIGRCGWANFDGCDGVICEDNSFPGADNMVRSGVTFWSQRPMQNAYFARNSMDHVYASDREGMSTDGASGKYFGPVVSASRNGLTIPKGVGWKPNELADHTCYVLGGTGQGQWRRVTGNTDTTLTVDRPWDTAPGADAIVGVNHTVAHLLIVGNTMADVGIAYQLYGTGMECIVAENRCIRAGGFYSHCARYPGGSKDERDTQPQMYIQYLDNQIVEGNTPFYIRGYDYGANHSVIGLDAYPGPAGKEPWKWPMARGFIIRGNRLNSNGTIPVKVAAGGGPPLIADVIVERNKASLATTGISIGPRTAGIVVRRNAFDQVEQPLVGEGLKGAFVER
jgi:hypothetical protein